MSSTRRFPQFVRWSCVFGMLISAAPAVAQTLDVVPKPSGPMVIKRPAATRVQVAEKIQLVAPVRPMSLKPTSLEPMGIKPIAAMPGTSVQDLETFVVQLAKLAIPEKYENTKHWGAKKSIPRGLKLSREDGDLKLRARKKKVNHGSWYFYRVTLQDPKQLELRLDNIEATDDGRFSFSVFAEAPVHTFARHSQWQWGAQLWSINGEIDSRVRVKADCSVQVQFNPTKLPPDVILKPRVESVDIELLTFELRRVSQLGNDITKPLSKTVRELIESELRQRRSELPAKINRQLEKKKDKFRISLHDIVQSKWKKLLPEEKETE